MKVKYQCIPCGKMHPTEEKAKECHNGPVQTVVQGITRWPLRRILGN